MGNIVTEYWRVCREFHCKEWTDGAVVYDAASGDTHHLTLAASQILNLIQRAPCTQEEITSHVLSPDAGDTETRLAIDGILSHLVELRLVESINH